MQTCEDIQLTGSPDIDTWTDSLLSFWRSGILCRSAAPAEPVRPDHLYDFITFLAVLQNLKIDFLPVTWQPALDTVGMGATAEIRQLLINLQMSFAFKRFRRFRRGISGDESTFQALISEVSVLGHSSIRGNPNVIHLEGVCWDVSPENERIWPVLVFEKTQYGDLDNFLKSDAGRMTSFQDRMSLCADVAAAVIIMHSCRLVHGDIKPQNVLIFKNQSDRLVAKVSDFGYSTLATRDHDLIKMPKSKPWNAPEHHHRGFRLSEAIAMDAYSFGMLCLWALFSENEEYPNMAYLEQLKSEDKLPTLAHKLIATTAGLDLEQKENLNLLLSSTLVSNPDKRNLDFKRLLQLLAQNRTTTIPNSTEDRLLESDVRLQITALMLQLYRSDYLVRSQFSKCLQERFERCAQNDADRSLQQDAAFQLALCYKVGFGVVKDDLESRTWLDKSHRQPDDLQHEIALLQQGSLGLVFPGGASSKLSDRGYLDMMDFAQHYRERQDLRRAELEYRREIRDVESVIGDSHEIVLLLKSILSSILYAEGMLDESEDLVLQTTEAVKKICGLKNQETLNSMTRLASIYRRQGRWKEAEGQEIQVMEISKEMHGHEHPFTLTCIGHLASTYQAQGRWKDAEELWLQVVELRKGTLGLQHPATITTIANLASLYHNNGQWKEAERLEIQVIEMSKRALGEKHPDTLISMANLASTYFYQGRWKEAEELEVQIKTMRHEELSQQHPDTLNSMANLATIYQAQGRWKEAEELGLQVRKMRAEVLGEFHPSTLTSISNLASTYRSQGRLKETEELEIQVLEESKTRLGQEHPDTLDCMNSLAVTYEEQGNWRKAEELLLQVVETRVEMLGQGHPDTLIALNNLASVYRSWELWEAAEKIFMQVLETSKNVLGEVHPHTLVSINNLATIYQDQGKLKESEELGISATETCKRNLGLEHPTTLASMANLAATWKLQAQDEKAIELLKEVVRGQTLSLGCNHPDTEDSAQALAEWTKEYQK